MTDRLPGPTYVIVITADRLRAFDIIYRTLSTVTTSSAMPLSSAQKTEVDAVIAALLDASANKKKRQLASMFLDLVDRESWPEYYEVILE